MDKWRISLFAFFILIGLFTSQFVINQQQPQPAILADVDVTNWATIASPTPTPTAGPTSTPTPTPTSGPSPTPTPSPTASPTSALTSTPTPTPRITTTPSPILSPSVSIAPSPTLIAHLSPTPLLPPTPTPTEEPERYYTYSLFGYTSSYAAVRLEGIKLLEGTKADENGYFEFNNFKASSYNLEFCLLTMDTENLVAPPLCVPVPKTETNRKYGPYLLPPTLSIAKGDVRTNESSRLSGKTIPGSNVNINVFSQPEKSLAQLIVPPVFAQSLNQKPEQYKLTATTDGSFSTNLKSSQSGKKRVFAQAVYNFNQEDNKTPKSVTLTLNILSTLMAILVQLLLLFRKLFSLNFVIVVQLALLLFLILKRKQLFSWYYLSRHKKMAIVLYRQQTLAKTVKNYCPLN